MVVGFVLITTEPGKEADIYTKLKEIEEIEESYPLFGEYDIMAKANGDSFQEIGEMVVNKIRTLDGIKETKTLTGISF